MLGSFVLNGFYYRAIFFSGESSEAILGRKTRILRRIRRISPRFLAFFQESLAFLQASAFLWILIQSVFFHELFCIFPRAPLYFSWTLRLPSEFSHFLHFFWTRLTSICWFPFNYTLRWLKVRVLPCPQSRCNPTSSNGNKHNHFPLFTKRFCVKLALEKSGAN